VIQTFFIDRQLPGLNEIIAENRRHYRAGARLKRNEQRHVVCAILMAKLKPATDSVWLEFKWIEPNRKRDKDNIAAGGRKIILDALVEAGVLAGDGWKHVDGFTDLFSVDDKTGVEVSIIEAGA
jgi:Holliday junction resolvase RusA-like endonuclease